MIVESSAPACASVSASCTTVARRWPIATYTEMTPESLLLMIVSIAIAVLPVWRSPMMSSRWPRPIGIIESIAFRPVCSGSVTGWRCTTPGALNSAGRSSLVSMSPLPSSGSPSGETMRPRRASPTGISRSWSVRLTVSPSTTCSHSPKSTAPTLSDSRFSARPRTPCGNSSISNDMQFSRPWMRAMPSPTDRTVPTSVSSADPSSSPSMRLLRMEVISSGLICMGCLSVSWGKLARVRRALGDLLAQALEAVADGCVEDLVADAQDDTAEDLGVDAGGELDLLAGLLADAIADALDGRLVELDRRRDLDRQDLVLALPHRIELAADAEQDGHAVLLDEELEEVHDGLVRVLDDACEAVLLLLRGEVGREEEHLTARGPRRARRRTRPAARGRRRACRAPARPRTANVRRPRRSLPWVSSYVRPRRAGEVEFAEGLFDQAALVVVGQGLAGDLLGRQHGEVGDLACGSPGSRGASPPRCRVRLLHELLALTLGRLALTRARVVRRPCARGRRSRRPARAPP